MSNGITVVWGSATQQETKFGWHDKSAAERVLCSHVTQAGVALKECNIVNLAKGSLKLTGARVIVACGVTAFQAVTGRQGFTIADDQCYVFPTKVGNELIPVILAFHPETIFREPNRSHWLAWAFKKARALAGGREMQHNPTLRIEPTFDEAIAYLKRCETEPIVAVDIEKPKLGFDLSCVSFAISAKESMSIPLMKQFKVSYWSFEQELQIWLAMSRILASPGEKVFQNFIFDTMCLRANGLETRGAIFDTMAAANTLNPRLEKSLGDLGRLYCFCEPWKEAQDWNLSGDMRTFWRYNAEDSVRTWHIAECQKLEIKQRGLHEFFTSYVAPLYPIVLDTCCRGMRVDVAAQQRSKELLALACEPLFRSLQATANVLLPPKQLKKKLRDYDKDTIVDGKIVEKAYKTVIKEEPQEFNPGSPAQIKQVLVGLGYQIPKYQGRETTDRGALLKMHRKVPHPFILDLIQWTRLNKIITSYANITLDADDRCRYSYAVGGTKSGRFSSSRTPWATGLNVQTLPRPCKEVPVNLRSSFIPDEGMTFVQVDLSQAELRVVAYLAREESLIRLLESGEDIHKYTAKQVGDLIGKEVPRALGKMLNHAANYGMGANRFSDACLEDAGLAVSAKEAEQLLRARARAFPGIVGWQKTVESDIKRTRRLVSPHGRVAQFYGPIDDTMIRDAYSFIPQATVADTTNTAWLKLAALPTYNKIFNVLQQGHDSLLIQVVSSEVDAFLKELNAIYSSLSVLINGNICVIPHDVTMGSNWGELHGIQH